MGTSRRRPLLLEMLEDRRVLSGFSVLPLAPLLADASSGLVQESVPAVGAEIALSAEVEMAIVGAEAQVEASASSSGGLDATIGAESTLAVGSEPIVGLATDVNASVAPSDLEASLGLETEVLSGPIDGSVQTDLVVGDGISGDVGGEIVVGSDTEINPGGSVTIEDPLDPLPELPGTPPGLNPPSDVGFVPPAFVGDVGGFLVEDGSSTFSTIDGRLRLTEAGFLVSEEDRLATEEEETDEDALVADEEALADGWRLSEEEENALLELVAGFRSVSGSGNFDPVGEMELLGLRQVGPGVPADESLLQEQGENFAFMGGAFDDFFRNVLGAFEAFKGWLARIGPVPWVVMGLAFGLACMEVVERRRHKAVRLREEEAAGA